MLSPACAGFFGLNKMPVAIKGVRGFLNGVTRLQEAPHDKLCSDGYQSPLAIDRVLSADSTTSISILWTVRTIRHSPRPMCGCHLADLTHSHSDLVVSRTSS